jgi:hypothetical protein
MAPPKLFTPCLWLYASLSFYLPRATLPILQGQGQMSLPAWNHPPIRFNFLSLYFCTLVLITSKALITFYSLYYAAWRYGACYSYSVTVTRHRACLPFHTSWRALGMKDHVGFIWTQQLHVYMAVYRQALPKTPGCKPEQLPTIAPVTLSVCFRADPLGQSLINIAGFYNYYSFPKQS